MSKAVWWVLVTVAVLLAGCSDEERTCESYRVDPSVPPAFVPGILEGTARWSVFAPADAVEIREDGVCVVRAVSASSDEYHMRAGKLGGGFQALWVPRAGEIWLVPENLTCGEDAPSLGCVAFATAHELGHAHGMKHVEDENAVMAATGLAVEAFTAADRAEYLRALSR